MIATPVRVALYAPDRFTRHILRVALAARDVSVVVEAASTGELAVLCSDERPDAVILFTSLVDQPLGLVEELAGEGIDVLAVGADSGPSGGMDLLAAGAAGFVTQNIGIDALIDALHDIRSGGCPLDARCAAPVVAEWRARRQSSPDQYSSAHGLSKREIEVLRLLVAGGVTKSIAAALEVSVKTVENHKTRIFSKLGVRSQAQAAAVALACGLVTDGDTEPGTVP